jgi:hypothetical protein
VLTPLGDILSRTEGRNVQHDVDPDTTPIVIGANLPIDVTTVTGAHVADARRVYMSTPSKTAGTNDGRRVLAYCYDAGDETTLALTWRYLPLTQGGTNLERSFHSSVVINADGTLLAVNDGYLIAIEPLRGDFNGDGCRNNFDVDAFNLALTDPVQWEADFGLPRWINLVAMGDCNHDGLVNNFDIDCFVDLIANHSACAPGFVGPCALPAFGGEAPQGAGEEDQWAHFWAVIAALREQFGG